MEIPILGVYLFIEIHEPTKFGQKVLNGEKDCDDGRKEKNSIACAEHFYALPVLFQFICRNFGV